MPIYSWKCNNCSEITEVEKPMAQIDESPEKCDHCSNPHFTDRVFLPTISKSVKQFILVDSGVGWAGHGFYTKV